MDPLHDHGRGDDQGPVGRALELVEIDKTLERATRTQSGAFLVVAGQPGMGRTELARAALERADARGMRTVDRPCWPDQQPPGWPWGQVLQDLGSPASELTVASPDVDPVGAVLEQCRRHPTLIVLDDLHHGGRDSWLLARMIAHSVRTAPLVVLATWRGDVFPTDTVAADIWRAADPVIILGPLGSDDVDLVLDRHPTLSAHQRETIAAQAGGNPLFIRELARAETLNSGQRPIVIDDLIRSAFSTASSLERQLAIAAVAFGPRTPTDLIATVLGTSQGQVLARASAIGALVTVQDSLLSPTSELVALAVRGLAAEHELTDMHRSIVRSIGSATDSVAATIRARHAVIIGHESAEDYAVAVESCRIASRSLARDGHLLDAADQLESAVGLARTRTRTSVEPSLLLESAEALLACGRLGDARERFDETATVAQQVEEHRLMARAALGLGGIWVEEQRDAPARTRLLGLLDSSLSILDRQASPSDEDLLLRRRLTVRRQAEDVYTGRASVADVADAVDDLRLSGDPRSIAEGLSLLHHTMLTPSHAGERLLVADEIIANAAACGDDLYRLMGQCWRAVDLLLVGAPSADAALEELRAHASARGNRSIEYIVAVLDAMRSFCRGDLEAAESMTTSAFELGTTVGDADAFAYYGGQLMALRWAQGRVGEIRPMIDDLANSPTLKTRDAVFPAACAGAAALCGDFDEARRWVSRVGPVADIPTFSTWLTTVFALTETAHLLDDDRLATELLDALQPFEALPVRASLGVTCLGPVTRLIGLLQATIGDLDAALDTLADAATDVRHLGNRPAEAIIEADRARLLLRRGRADDVDLASSMLRTAIESGESMALTGRVEAWRTALERHPVSPTRADVAPPEHREAALRRCDDGWLIERDGLTFAVADSVGIRHLTALLARPNVEFSALELSSSTGPSEVFSSMPLIDDEARRQYRRRIGDLERDIVDADADADIERASMLRTERDSLITHLAANVDRNGRSRQTSDSAERARMRVSRALRRAIAKIESADPVIGRELTLAIRTGRSCVYATEPSSRRWTVIQDGLVPRGQHAHTPPEASEPAGSG